MPVRTVAGGRLVVHIALLIAVIAGVVLVAGVLDAAFAQGGPFGAPRSQAPARPAGGAADRPKRDFGAKPAYKSAKPAYRAATTKPAGKTGSSVYKPLAAKRSKREADED